MEIISYDELCEKIAKLTKEKEIQDVLHELRVPRCNTPYFTTACNHIMIYVSSGFSMGESVVLVFDDGKTHKMLFSYNNEKEYSKSCTWRAKHGYVKFVFQTKTQLRVFCEACKNQDHDTMRTILTETFDKKSSEIKNNYKNVVK